MPRRLQTNWATLTQGACRPHPLGQEDQPEQAPELQPIGDVLPLDWVDVDVEDQEEEPPQEQELPLSLWPDQVAVVNSIDTLDEADDDFAEAVAVDDFAEAVDVYAEAADAVVDAMEAVADAMNSIDAYMAAERAVYNDLNTVAAERAANPALMEAAQLAVVSDLRARRRARYEAGHGRPRRSLE